MAFLYPNLFPDYIGCLPETADGQIEMPLKDTMALVWKAKTLMLNISLSATGFYATGSTTNTLEANTEFFLGNDGSYYPPPIETMSGLACGETPEYVFRDGTNYSRDNDNFFGDYAFTSGSGPGSGPIIWAAEFGFTLRPISLRTAGGEKRCDLAFSINLDPRSQGNLGLSYYISTLGPYAPHIAEGGIFTSIPNGAVIKVDGNTHSTDLYFTTEGYEEEAIPIFTSLIASGEIRIEIESERLAE